MSVSFTHLSLRRDRCDDVTEDPVPKRFLRVRQHHRETFLDKNILGITDMQTYEMAHFKKMSQISFKVLVVIIFKKGQEEVIS